MKETRRYFPQGINESVNRLRPRGTSYRNVRGVRANRSGLCRRAGSTYLTEAIKSNDVVTEDNMEAVARKIKKVTGYKVCFDNGNLVCCKTNKVIVRNALNGKRKFDDLVAAVEKFCEKLESKTACVKESVAERFAAYRHLYESKEDDASDDDSDPFNFDDLDLDDKADDKTGDKVDDDKADDNSDDKSDDKKDSEEDVPMTAVVLTVKHGDGEKLKDELIDAGISEDDIDVIEGEDDEDDKVKVDADSIMDLKTFLKDSKGIDLEEKLGGEIIDDEDNDDKKDDSKDSDDTNGSDDDLDFGDDDLDALFGADDDSADDAK